MNKVLLKNLSYLFLLISLFSFSQEEILVVNFAKGDYPFEEKVKILFDKDWRPTAIKDSAEYYRLITFKEKNIPKGRVEDYYRNGTLQSKFYANYIGVNNQGIDSVLSNGPSYYYNSLGNKDIERNYVNGIQAGEENYYYETGKIQSKSEWIDGLIQGQQIVYYESGATKFINNYLDGSNEGQQIRYYESGETDYTVNYVDDLLQGQEIGYYESG